MKTSAATSTATSPIRGIPDTLSEHLLPGPNTATKREALLSVDPRFRLLLHEAARIDWPVAYGNDLYVYDRQLLEKTPAGDFVWILRSHGTHLYPVVCDTSAEQHYRRCVIEYWSGDDRLNRTGCVHERARYYLLSGNVLRNITWQQAESLFTVREPT